MKLLRASLVPLALIVVALIRLLKHCGLTVRFGLMFSSRIGHLVGNMDTYLCERADGLQKGIDFWAHWGEPCNRTIAKMLGERVTVDPTGFTVLVIKTNKLFDGWFEHEIPCADIDRDPKGLRAKHGPQLSITAAQEREGEETLARWGLPRGAKWVCFMVRDAAYLPTLGYHAYRDSEIEDFTLAALALAERGYYVFRMGAKVAKPWDVNHRLIIDYATNGFRSDFMDVYLGARCDFAVSTSTGWDAIPQAFRRPLAYANFVPYEYMPTWMANSVAIWKHHWKDGRRMTLKEMHRSGCGQFMRADEFAAAGIELRPNTPQEIRDTVLEMLARPDDNDLQIRFWRDFPVGRSTASEALLHGTFNLRIGHKFLKDYLDTGTDGTGHSSSEVKIAQAAG